MLARWRAGKSRCIAAQGDAAPHYRELFEHSHDAIMVVGVQPGGAFAVERLNPVAVRMLWGLVTDASGWPLAALRKVAQGTPLAGMLDNLETQLTCARDRQLPVRYRDRCPCAQGSEVQDFEIQIIPMADDGGLSHLLCFAHDISAQLRYERELQQHATLQERLSGFVASAPGFFYTFEHGADGRNRMPFASEGMRELFGLTPQQVAGNIGLLFTCIHPDDLARFFDAIAQSTVSLRGYSVEFRVHHPQRGELWIESRAMPVAREDGSIVWNGFMHEVTERKQGELALHDRQAKLHALVINREKQREQERTRVAWEMHEELGQVLSAIKMNLSGLRGGALKNGRDLEERAVVISELVDRSIRIMRDIVEELRPTVLMHGIAAGLEWLVGKFNRHPGIVCRLQLDGWRDGEVDGELQTLMFRLAQEALEDALRHPGVSEVCITLRSEPQHHVLAFWHNGDAAAVDLTGSHSLRLFGMHERIVASGGSMQVDSGQQPGITIAIRFPR